jgi:DNA-binding LacI/PurR family transcriptional regulator
MTTMRRVTLREVAQASGVSRSTVSFVLNDRSDLGISAQTRARVQKAADDLGYAPHGIAKALAEGVSRIVVLEIGASRDGNYRRTFIRGLDDELASHEHVLLVRHGRQSAPATDRMLDAIAPRAVLQFGAAYRRGDDLDDIGGGWRDGLAAHVAIQVGHLIERGHTSLAIALPGADVPLGGQHLHFAREVARRHHLPAPATFVITPPRGTAAAMLEAFRAEHPEVTAIAAFDDDTALRILAAIADLGLRAPVDLAVIGYDETDFSALTTPALTTVHIDAEVHGRIFARTALDLDHSDLARTPARVVLRDST